MINKKLLNTSPESKKFIGLGVFFQWLSLVANIVLMFTIAGFVQQMFLREFSGKDLLILIVVSILAIGLRLCFTVYGTKMGYYASKNIKAILRERIYKKVLALGPSYNETVSTSEVVQMAVEGTGQLENYFGLYMPQFFYSMLAPLTLFVVLCKISLLASTVLLICVPLIPISIALVQTWAKKLLSKYWGKYTSLGDTFLENLQGLTTLKIYGSDDRKNQEMNQEAEEFRKITMKVLTMQLNSITIMDIFAYGGSALGIIIALIQLHNGTIDLKGALLITLLSAEFFLPMRLLGSYFHIAMNGMAAWAKIDKFINLKEANKSHQVPLHASSLEIQTQDLSFSYDETRGILSHINLSLPSKGLVAIVGESGCGKSTLASIITGRTTGYTGMVSVNGRSLDSIDSESLMSLMVSLPHNAYIFKGTVADNLILANPNASQQQMISALEQARVWDELKDLGGLDLQLTEKGSNLSGGQCQRIGFARGLLHQCPFYLFDEATSNIDVESEDMMIKEIYKLAQQKSVMMISHRLANVVNADLIYVMDSGRIIAKGTHSQLLENCAHYKRMWQAQQALENIGLDKADSNLLNTEGKEVARGEQ